ncbi:MAG: DUF4058 family protein [Isosphaeraceae bacterium]
MAGPFPGMDPYIESQGNWQDFHNRLVAELSNLLGVRLPEDYVARVDERIEVVGFDEEGRSGQGVSYLPDVLVARREGGAASSEEAAGGVATLAPLLVEVSERDPEEVRHTWLEIRRLPELELVTVVEVLSPVNKTGPGRSAYLDKREALHAQRVNLVEIDLLLGGPAVPMKRPVGAGLYYAVVARGPKLPVAEVYRWTVRDRLPAIPIPLREPDPDVPIGLDEPVSRVYDLGRYGRTIRYDRPLPEALPLSPEDRAWVERLRGARVG